MGVLSRCFFFAFGGFPRPAPPSCSAPWFRLIALALAYGCVRPATRYAIADEMMPRRLAVGLRSLDAIRISVRLLKGSACLD